MNIKKWLKEVKENTDLKCVKYLIGNKIDLVEKKEKIREVTFEEGQIFAIQNNLYFYETSACTNYNISEAFEEMIESKRNFFFYVYFIYISEIPIRILNLIQVI